MSIFGKRKGSTYTEEEVQEIVDKQLARRDRNASSSTGDDAVDRVLEGLNRVTDKLEDLDKREEGKKSSGGGILGGDFSDMLKFFDRLNIDSAGKFGIAQGQEIEKSAVPGKGPLGSNGLPIGGAGYDPAAGDQTNNGRIIKWLVNSVVLTSRGSTAFYLATTALLKWEILDLLTSNDGDTSGFDMEELFMFSILSSGFGGGTTGSGNPLDFLSGLFGAGSPVLNPTPVYSNV